MNSEILGSESLNLTLEQQFQLEFFERQTQSFSRDRLEALLLQATQLLMLKDNIIRNILHDLPE